MDYFCGKREQPGIPMGTNYECMRKGVGVGSRAKLPKGYKPEAVDPRKSVYCGERSHTPSRKHKGTPHECFQKGFGIGKKLQARKKSYFDYGFGHDCGLDGSNELISIIVALVAFGLLWLLDVQMMWAVIAGAIMGVIYYWFCTTEW